MQIRVNSVDVEVVKNAKGGYKVALVKYVREGKDEEKKVMSFTNPGVFATLTGLSNFPIELDVKAEKNAKGYWEWVAASTEVGGAKGPAPAAPSRVSNFETPQERAARQVMIVRQSSLANAVALAAANGGKKNTPEEIIDIAKHFEGFVMGERIEDIKDDIPF